MTENRDVRDTLEVDGGESLEAARARVRAIGVREVRRRGRRRTMTRASVVVVLAMGVVGVVGLSQFGRGAIEVGGERGEIVRARDDGWGGRVRWVSTDWSIAERAAAHETGLVRWVTNDDLPEGRIERVRR